jgi:uncharacterized membrane protein
LPRLLYIFLFLAGLLLVAYYYPQMPLRMASHFAADGRPNGWMPREPFFLIMFLVTASSAMVAFFAPRQIAAKSNDRINLPNRDYWLAPERREETMRYIAAMMGWFGCGLLFVLISGTFLAMQANLAAGGRFHSEAMLVVLVGFLFLLLFWLIRFVRHFQQTDAGR